MDFIIKFKGKYAQALEDTFLFGYCYYFAKMLEERFNGEIYYLPIANHFITKIDNFFYDIKGLIISMEEKPYSWKDYQCLDELEVTRIKKYCILKEDSLRRR